MNCHNTKKNLVSYLKGEITANTRQEISDHLKKCHGCTAELQKIKNHLYLYQNLPDFSIQPNWTSLLEKIQESPQQKISPFRKIFFMRKNVILQLAGVFLIVCSICLYYLSYSQPTPQSLNSPLAIHLNLEQEQAKRLLGITLSNITQENIILSSISSPLMLHIEQEEKKFVQPITNCMCKNFHHPVAIKPGEHHHIICDVSNMIQTDKEYTVTVVCHGCQLENCCCTDDTCTCSECGCQKWKGKYSSQPLRILAQD